MKYIFGLLLVSTLFSCTTTLLFTNEQFPEVASNTSIPSEWQGMWLSADSTSSYITQDSLYIGGFYYKIIPSNLNLELDSDSLGELDSLAGRDKLIFKNDWCFLEVYNKFDSIPSLNGYRILVGNKDKNGNILCWEMSYEYFLKHMLINKIPAIKHEYINLSSENGIDIKKIALGITYIEIPQDQDINKYLYRKIIRKIAFGNELMPFLCDFNFDFDFFKKVAKSRKPDVILTNKKTVTTRGKNRNEKKYEKSSTRNYERNLLKRLKTDF